MQVTMDKKPKLTLKQRKFIAAYTGNGAEAARKAGYSEDTAKQIAYENFTKPYLKNEIVNKVNAQMKKIIADSTELQTHWTNVLRDETVDMPVRLKASELHGKSLAMFTENINVNKTVDVSLALTEAKQRLLAKCEQTKVIEAELIDTKQNAINNTPACPTEGHESRDALENFLDSFPNEIPDFLK